MTWDQEEKSDGSVLLSRPRDESLEAFKDWIGELYERITGQSMEGDTSMSEEKWRERHAEFWRKMKAEVDEE